jgi:hypothetical protein
MNLKIAHEPVIILLTVLLTACGSGGSPESAAPATPANAGNSGCIDRSMAVGIEGGGLRRLLGAITSIGNDGTLVIGCRRVLAADAVIVVDGHSGNLTDLQIGQVVEILGSIDPESGNLEADRVTTAAAPGPHGRYVGTVTIGGVDYFGDALLTVDGALRLYVGGSYDDGGQLELSQPENSAQLVANLQRQGNDASGSGIVIGQGCASAEPIRFCNETASGEISVVVDQQIFQGEIRVSTGTGEETWLVDLWAWDNYYVLSAEPQYVAGQYQEQLAEFNEAANMIIAIDADGRLFFQSAPSSCTGNGTLTRHLDGRFNVYDVELTLESCAGGYAYLNGVYEGLATTTPSNYWNYDALLRVWLSKRDAAAPAAVTLLGFPIYPP